MWLAQLQIKELPGLGPNYPKSTAEEAWAGLGSQLALTTKCTRSRHGWTHDAHTASVPVGVPGPGP